MMMLSKIAAFTGLIVHAPSELLGRTPPLES
jgi:hypothetical protein